MCKAGVNIVITLALQYNSPGVSCMCVQKKCYSSNFIIINFFVSRGRKSMLLFTSGERKAEVLMTSVGLGVTRLRTCWYRQMVDGNSYTVIAILFVLHA